MIHGNYCEKCYKKSIGQMAMDVMTSYTCGLCNKSKLASSSAIPEYCCPECSEEKKCCEECGDTVLITVMQKEEFEKEYWSNFEKEYNLRRKNEAFAKYKVGDTFNEKFTITEINDFNNHLELKLVEKETGRKASTKIII